MSKVSGRHGLYIDFLKFETNRGKSIEVGNSKGGQPFEFPAGRVQGVAGGVGFHLHNINVRFAKELSSSSSDSRASENVDGHGQEGPTDK